MRPSSVVLDIIGFKTMISLFLLAFVCENVGQDWWHHSPSQVLGSPLQVLGSASQVLGSGHILLSIHIIVQVSQNHFICSLNMGCVLFCKTC